MRKKVRVLIKISYGDFGNQIWRSWVKIQGVFQEKVWVQSVRLGTGSGFRCGVRQDGMMEMGMVGFGLY